MDTLETMVAGDAEVHTMNGIDVSDPTHNLMHQEWEALGASNQALLLQMRNCANNPNAGGQGHGRGWDNNDNTQNASANVSSVTFEGDTPKQSSNQSEGLHWFWPWGLWRPTEQLTPWATSHTPVTSAAHLNFTIQATPDKHSTAAYFYHFTALHQLRPIPTCLPLPWAI